MSDFRGKTVAIYARFSSDMQSEASIDDQVRRCRHFVEERGARVAAAHIFTDAAVSGASLARPGVDKLMTAVRKGEVDAVVVEDVSRLSRDLADSTALYRELDFRRVMLVGVADGIDTSSRGAKMHFAMRSLMSDMYLDDLRDKTRRGLEGRALAGYSTGGLPIGYKSEAEVTADGRVIGHRVLVDEERAAVVRRIFSSYLAGQSHEAIARELNAQQVEPARRGRYRHKGWSAESVRAILKNKSYIGVFSYGQREWRKLPGTNTRRYRAAPADRVITKTFPERRIIDDEMWRAVQERLEAVRAFYSHGRGRNGKSSTPGKQTSYPLSGLLRCAHCGGLMIIAGGSSAAYYRCRENKKRGRCPNRVSLREDVARKAILRAIRERFTSPTAIAYLRKRLSERLGHLGRELDGELVEVERRLDRTKERIGRLVGFIADGDTSPSVRDALKDLEAQRASDEQLAGSLRSRKKKPVPLPSPDELLRRAADLEQLIESHPTRGREALFRLFPPTGIMLTPNDQGVYTAKSTLFVLAIIGLNIGTKSAKARHPLQGPGSVADDSMSGPALGCAGRI